jgi:hypothetical protein
LSSRIRRIDVEDKVEHYGRAGIAEYLIVDSKRRDRRFRLLGYRLDGSGWYQPIEPDAEGRLLSETTGLWFQASPDGGRVLISEYPSGRPLLTREEEVILRKAAEERAWIEAEAHKAAEERARIEAEARRVAEERAWRAEERVRREAEAREAAEGKVARLQAELDRLRGRG